MKNYLLLICIQFFCTAFCKGQQEYNLAFRMLDNVLSGDSSVSFKDCIFIVENTFDERIDYETYNSEIQFLVNVVNWRNLTGKLDYKGKDIVKISKYAAIFSTLTDTTRMAMQGGIYENYPFRYNFEDVFGSNNWENMFVYELLKMRKGNCHSLPYLYKILCDELNVPCHLALAPNHVYIKHRADKGGWYNTELTSASFPIDAWLMASGYISLEAVQKATYFDTLSKKETITLCVIDLAQGFNHKYPLNDGKFVIECCDLALKYFPNYVNAILLKAETRLKQLQVMQKRYGYEYLKEVTVYPEAKALWDDMNGLYMQLYKLGYRQMPEQMYVEWLTSLKTEKEKYNNKNAPGATKD